MRSSLRIREELTLRLHLSVVDVDIVKDYFTLSTNILLGTNPNARVRLCAKRGRRLRPSMTHAQSRMLFRFLFIVCHCGLLKRSSITLYRYYVKSRCMLGRRRLKVGATMTHMTHKTENTKFVLFRVSHCELCKNNNPQ